MGHDDVRSAHRTGVSNVDLQRLKIIRVFLLAEIPFHEKYITQESVENEHMHFNDIVQGNFIQFHFVRFKQLQNSHFQLFFFLFLKGNFMESYRNLSYKHIMGLRYAAFHSCLQPKFIIKMDDDIVVNFYQLVEYLTLNQEHFSNENDKKHFLSGYIFRNVVPIRLQQNKWFVSQDEFRGNVYPNYLSGWMYVTVPYTARSLLNAAFDQKTSIFWIDDTWITGILRERQRIPIDNSLNELFSANSQFLDCCINDFVKFKYKCPFIAGPNGGDNMLIRKFLHTVHKQCYNALSDLSFNQCKERDPNLPSIKKICVGSDKHLLQNDHGMAIINSMKL